MTVCMTFPCKRTAAGCPVCDPAPRYAPNPYPRPVGAMPMVPQGCICPPTSEKTCENPTCPRKGIKISATGVGKK